MVTVTNLALPPATADLLLILESYAKTPPQKNRPAPDVYYTSSAGKLTLLSQAMEGSLKKLIEKYAPGSSVTPAPLTFGTPDTNLTITAAGTPAAALLKSVELTLSWTGTLAVDRGGTGLGALGTANQLLRVNAGATALEYFTPSFLTTAITSINSLTSAAQSLVTGTSGTDFGISSSGSTHTFNLPVASATNTGKLSNTDWVAFNAKEPAITVLPISKGGTNSSTVLNNNRVMKSASGAIIEAAAITAARAVISDANGIPTHSAVTDTELGYVSGVTSSIQTQITARKRIWYYDYAAHSLTGTTTETLLGSAIPLPLNLNPAQIEVVAWYRCNPYTSGTNVFRYRIGTNTGSPALNTAIAIVNNTSVAASVLKRTYTCATNSLKGFAFATSVASDEISGLPTGNATVDWTVQQYLFPMVLPGNNANVNELMSITIYLMGV